MNGQYRPHGHLDWMLGQLPAIRNWDLIGAIGAEQRSLAVVGELSSDNLLGNCALLRIKDKPSPYLQQVEQLLARREKELQKLSLDECKIYDADLMSDLADLMPLCDTIFNGMSENVILDISSLPKRFFFYILRRLIASPNVQTLVVTVSIPSKYGKVLSRDAGRWDYLPSFGRESSEDAHPFLVIGVGYQHLNLLDLVDDTKPQDVRLLFPFPSKPPGAIRNWEFVRRIEAQKKFRLKPVDILRVHPQATSLAFDLLVGQCGSFDDEVWLAPFGPKSISLAMALFSLARQEKKLPVSVGYTQPTAYSAEYSIGVELNASGKPVVYAYAIKLNGNNYYTIS